MEGLLFIIVLLCLYFINKNINTKFEQLNKTIADLQKKVFSKDTVTGHKNVASEEEKIVIPEVIKTVAPIIPTPKKEEIIITPSVTNSLKTTPVLEDKKIAKQTIQQTKDQAVKSIPEKSFFENFKEKNPDLEKFIGENLINKLGILILVLGISFFVKYAIDKDWINEPARVGIGVLCGSLIMAIAHKLKKNYTSFSSVLVAGAISVFYFTIYIAFHEYELFSQSVAFAIMTVITIFSTLVSVSYNKQELAVLSLIGGFAAPFMVSTGEGNYVVLFTYIAILNIGMLVISYFKKWRISTVLSFIFTTILFGSWCNLKIGSNTFSHTGALIFATLFYFIFSITIVLNNLRNKGKFSDIEYFILVANTFVFFGLGMLILNDLASNLTGLFTLLLALYNITYATILYKKFGLDKNAIYLLIGLALTFVTLTIPIQFEGNIITLFWALEAVLLFWLSQKSKIDTFKIGAIAVQILTLISLFLDWDRYSFTKDLNVILNPLFIAGFVVSCSLFLTYWLLKKAPKTEIKQLLVSSHSYANFILIIAILASYFTGILETNYQANQFLANIYSALSFSVTYHFIFISVLIYTTSTLKNNLFTKAILLISCISILSYILFFYKLPANELIENFLENTNTSYAFYFHYIILSCLIYFGYQLYKTSDLLFKIKPKQRKWLPWIFTFAIVYILSNEIMIHGLHLSNTIDTVVLSEKFTESENDFYDKNIFVRSQISATKTQIIKIGYPILWGVFSFIFLIIGIKKQWKNLRVIALSLLGLTILKLFIYDIKNVSETGKIIAFILLGVLILIISFVYQKLKKLVVDEKIAKNDIENDAKKNHQDEKI
ncbi:DUF2339 domain-containing protein [Tenacibaculum finnmarkense]|uniref:DUF2339 domain-containing protein n=1 Tax=Tenacibaculum finnmarkense TaxID=2781243 RepID=UPI000C468A4C|nr:DUF2339 domain-containing protein [Tenacibaculum finnmarkense]MCD8438462.1 DUF2339 domain-containing protein [Tenacibaculum finnmarkense genomovar ulcerans]MCG8719397.1 DUF2339 domain-containing protein [Tenacibaculum finnmarkense]SOS53753.1 conserved membrane hypothetical protein [Tenacibaculum finnmarkense]